MVKFFSIFFSKIYSCFLGTLFAQESRIQNLRDVVAEVDILISDSKTKQI